uniref:inositol 1,4,5-triphosphate receptor associated 2 isoform X3 n=1 Tax=Doryrhamphus excisus TaxID=161450 RepID=UPI0025AE587A|nr:inositol 1,4,5-triphosphate receptor associated 2 isoform X3 [Doryrhamphus excisus]
MTAAHAVMHPEPDGETSGHDGVGPCDSNDSDEESSQWGPLTTWSGLSIIDRVGLNSGKMSETDLENTFSQIALAFSCDQYTLKQRLQAEEHARNLAEENIKVELSRGRETLEALKGLCLDSKRSKILQRLEMCMDILAGTVERISNTAEVLGAVHKEAHVSRAVELMVAHVENVRRRLDRHEAELEEAKKMILQQNSCRSIVEPGAPLDSDNRQTDSWKKCMQQNGSRRRVSMSFIPSDVLPHQKKGKRESKKRASRGEGDTGSRRIQVKGCLRLEFPSTWPPIPQPPPPQNGPSQPNQLLVKSCNRGCAINGPCTGAHRTQQYRHAKAKLLHPGKRLINRKKEQMSAGGSLQAEMGHEGGHALCVAGCSPASPSVCFSPP